MDINQEEDVLDGGEPNDGQQAEPVLGLGLGQDQTYEWYWNNNPAVAYAAAATPALTPQISNNEEFYRTRNPDGRGGGMGERRRPAFRRPELRNRP